MPQLSADSMARILIIEDQKKLVATLQRELQAEGYEVVVATNGDEGFERATAGVVDVIVLDLMLPRIDGLSILRNLRASGFVKPILVLTARDSVEDRVLGLDSGANDYLVKPFAFAELLARIRALLRRGFTDRELTLRVGDVEVDAVSRRVTLGGEGLELSKREYELLEYLLRNKNEVISRETIAAEVWKETTGIMTNLIDVYIMSLRKKIDTPGVPSVIQTVRGIGYTVRDDS